MPLRLDEYPVACVNKDDCEVRGRRAGDHVPRVLLVAGRVCDDEVTLRRRKIAIGHIDRDLLLSLGFEAIGQQSEVEHGSGADTGRVRFQGKQVILIDRLRVVQQAPDQGRFAVVHTPQRREPKQVFRSVLLKKFLYAQKYPSRFFVSIDPSSSWSMTRVARSQVRLTIISSTI